MNNQKTIIIASFVIAVAAAGLAVFFYQGAQKEFDKIRSLKHQADIILKQREEIMQGIEALDKEKEQLIIRLEDYGKKVQNYELDISKLKSEKENINQQLSAAENTASTLKVTLEPIRAQEAALKGDLVKAQSKHEELVSELEYARKEKSELEEKLKSYMQKARGVELRKIVVRVTRPAEGSIVEVSRKYNFAVIDLGVRDDIKSGDALEIYRNNRMIARALIENVYDDMSSIVVFDEWRDAELVIGDTVKLQRN
jgi:predicted nuclease with TOPRIM domain